MVGYLVHREIPLLPFFPASCKESETFKALQESGNTRWGEGDIVQVWGKNLSLSALSKQVMEQAQALATKAENLEKGIYT